MSTLTRDIRQDYFFWQIATVSSDIIAIYSFGHPQSSVVNVLNLFCWVLKYVLKNPLLPTLSLIKLSFPLSHVCRIPAVDDDAAFTWQKCAASTSRVSKRNMDWTIRVCSAGQSSVLQCSRWCYYYIPVVKWNGYDISAYSRKLYLLQQIRQCKQRVSYI